MLCNNTRFIMLALVFVVQNLAITLNGLFSYYAVCVNNNYPADPPLTVPRMYTLTVIACMSAMFSSCVSIYLHRIFGIKKTFIAYTAFGGVAAFFCGISSKFTFWLIAICQGFFSGAAGNCMAQFYFFANAWAPKQDLGIFMGVAMTIFDVPGLLGGQYYGLLCEPLGWRNFYYIMGAVDLIFILLFLIFYTDYPADNPLVSPEELKYILDGQISNTKKSETVGNVSTDIRALVTDLPILLGLLFGSPVFVMFLEMNILTPIYISKIYHTSDFVIGNLCSIGWGVSLFVKLCFPVVDKFITLTEQTKFYLYGTICTVSGTASLVLLGLAQNDSIWMIYVGLFLYGLTGFGALSFNKAIVIMTQQYSELFGNVTHIMLDVSGIVISLPIMIFIDDNINSLRTVWLAISAYTLLGYTAQLLTFKLKPRPFTGLHSNE